MATISEELAREVAKNNGHYEGDPQAYAVFKYHNAHHDKVCYAVVWSKQDFNRYLFDGAVTLLEILWSRDGSLRIATSAEVSQVDTIADRLIEPVRAELGQLIDGGMDGQVAADLIGNALIIVVVDFLSMGGQTGLAESLRRLDLFAAKARDVMARHLGESSDDQH